MKHSHRLLVAALLSAATIPMPAFADPGVMVHMTINAKIQISNPPMTVPSPVINRDVCTPKQPDMRQVITQTGRNKDCSYSAYKESGNTVTYHYACAGQKGNIDGDASFTMDGGGAFHGTSHNAINMQGQAATVDTTYQATPTGATCESTSPAASK